MTLEVFNLPGLSGQYKPIYLTALSGLGAANSPAPSAVLHDSGSNDITIWGVPFSASAAQRLAWTLPLPLDWDKGPMYFRANWGALSGTGDNIWNMHGACIAPGTGWNAEAMGPAGSVTQTLSAASTNEYTPLSSPVNIAGIATAGSLLALELRHDPTATLDTFSGTAILVALTVFYGYDAGRV